MEVHDNRKSGTFDKIKNSPTWKKIKSIKNIQLVGVIFIIAMALIIYSSIVTKKDTKSKTVNNVASVTMNDEESKLSAILGKIVGAGRVETMITRRGDEIVGVLVIAEGADNITVLCKLVDATTTVLNIEKKLVDVYKMK